MDASTTLEIQATNPDNNFFIDKLYTFGDITITILLIIIIAILFFGELRKYKN
jgi:hypothetical protein